MPERILLALIIRIIAEYVFDLLVVMYIGSLAYDVCSLGPEKASGICDWSLNVLYLWLLYAAEFRDNHRQMH